jgi:hypothetical protein
MSNSVRSREMTLPAAVAWTVAIFAVAAAVWGARLYYSAPSSSTVARESAVSSPTAPPPQLSAIELAAWRWGAWDKIVPRLDEADRLSRAAVDDRLAGLDDFFREHRDGVRPFAEAVLSLSGKWNYAKSKLPTAEDDAHLKFLDERFEKFVFSRDELRITIESVVAGYLSRLDGLEGQLLVEVRADLSEKAFAVPGAPRFDVSNDELRSRFARSLTVVSSDVARDVGVGVSLTTASVVGGEVAAVIAVRVATAVATRLGVSAGILGVGATSGWATFGIGLVAAVAVDFVIDKAARAAGYDPIETIAGRVKKVLDDVRTMLVDGDPEAVAAHTKLTAMARDDVNATVREESRRAADAIERSGNLGLRRELLRIHEQRAALRREALRRLIFTGET